MSQIPPSEWGETSEDTQKPASAPPERPGSETPAATDVPSEESPPAGDQSEQGWRSPAGGGYAAPPPESGYPVAPPGSGYPAGGYPQAFPPAGGYPQAPPPAGGYGQAPPPYGGYGQAPPPYGGYGQAPPPYSGYGQAPPPYGGYGQAPPPYGGYGQAPPPYGQPGYGPPPYGQGYGAPPGGLPPYGWTGGPDAGRYGYGASGAGTLAGYGPRVVAYILDALIVGIPVGILTVAGGLGRFGDYSLDAVVAFAYATLLIGGATAQTIGMRVMKIGVAEAANRSSPVGYGRAAGRAGVALLIGLIVFIGPLLDLLWPLWDPTNQTLHDKAAGTVVLRR